MRTLLVFVQYLYLNFSLTHANYRIENRNTLFVEGKHVKFFNPPKQINSSLIHEIIIIETSLENFTNISKSFPNLLGLTIVRNENIKNWISLRSFRNLAVLNISGQDLEEIPLEIFNLDQLVCLRILSSKIRSVSSQIINLKSLEIVDFSYNNLESFPYDILKIKSLEFLNLKNNQIREISNFSILPKNLKQIDLDNNKLDSFPVELLNTESLETLKISGNNFKEIPLEITKLRNLTHLSLSNGNLTEFPQQLLKLSFLKHLELANNKISFIPKEIKQLSKLKIIDLSKNSLKILPLELFEMASLREINLSDNEIKLEKQETQVLGFFARIKAFLAEYFPSFFKKNTNLEVLKIANNSLKEIPEEFFKNKNLKEVFLSGNSLKTVPKSLKNIKILDVSKNQLSDLPDSIFTSSLIQINISYNNFTKLPENLFIAKYLQELNAEGNQITDLPEKISLLRNLNELTLTGNYIESLPDNFKYLSKLKILHISSNNFETFPSCFQSMGNLNEIYLFNNELTYLPKNWQIICERGTKLHVSMNFIENAPFEEISGISFCKFEKLASNLSFQPQFDRKVTIEEVLQKYNEENIHWNFEKLKNIKLQTDLTVQAKNISDKSMRKMWREVIKHFLEDENKSEDFDSESTTEVGIDSGDLMCDAAINNLISITKENLEIESNGNIPQNGSKDSLRRKTSNYLRNLSEGKDIELTKSYIKVLFVNLLQVINKNNTEELEILKSNLLNLCTNSLPYCITGQMEGLQFYYSFYNQGNLELPDIESFITRKLASIKEESFISVAILNNKESVHFINAFRRIFKDLLGISNLFEDPYNLCKTNEWSRKAGNILESFLNKFTVKEVCSQLLEEINGNKENLNNAFDFLVRIETKQKREETDRDLDDDELFSIKNNTSFKYFECDIDDKIDEEIFYYYKSLKENGILKILEKMELLVANDEKSS